MTILVLALGGIAIALLLVALVATYLLGFRLGGHAWTSETHRIRAEAARAERELHELTRTAFVAMAEEAQRHRRNR